MGSEMCIRDRYFETEERAYQGICCVCHKKGCLGRCPNPECGLLMHFSCVKVSKPGGVMECPVCRTESALQDFGELPKWHEAEVGAPIGRRGGVKTSPAPVRQPTFPAIRWPSEEEARLGGFQSLKDWYVHDRMSSDSYIAPTASYKQNLNYLEAEFAELQAKACLLYTSPSPRDGLLSRMPSSA